MVTELCYRLPYSLELFDSRIERTARWKFTGQVDFLSRLEMTCNKTDGARKFRRWRCYRPTWKTQVDL